MIKDLMMVVDSPIFGKKILYRIPQQLFTITPTQQSKPALIQFVNKLIKKWDYFGFVNQQSVALDLNQQVFVNFFSANVKYSNLSIQIDEQICVAKSVFFTSPYIIQTRQNQSILPINSFNIVAMLDSYEHIQTVKHLLSFAASMIQLEENVKNSLSKQFPIIRKQKEQFVNVLKEILNKLMKDEVQQQCEAVSKIEEDILKKIKQASAELTRSVWIFSMFRYLYDCANNKNESVKNKKEGINKIEFKWQGWLQSTQNNLKNNPKINPKVKHRSKIADKNIMQKTLLHSKEAIKQKLGEPLPKRLQNILSSISPFQTLEEITFEKRIYQHQLRMVAQTLVQNNIAILVHPIHLAKFVTCLTKKPPLLQLQSEYKLKPGSGLGLIKKFETYRGMIDLREFKDGKDKQSKQIRELQVKLMLFLILNGIIRQAQIYIYDKKPGIQLNQLNQFHIYNKLKDYSFSGKSVHDIGRNIENIQVSDIFTFLNKNSSHIGFYYVQ